jgi:hypothetical protein
VKRASTGRPSGENLFIARVTACDSIAEGPEVLFIFFPELGEGEGEGEWPPARSPAARMVVKAAELRVRVSGLQ